MKCPFCGNEDTKVIDSRPSEENNSIRRRRQCDVCSKRFTTYEKVEAIPLVVIKKDENRE
ncbi:MAG: transcriptional repressor NrdR, partial [Lachnospiraceae bacterium]|nr:transcriptional repressor NrdR [Lachnospiraceae bacterium]